MKRECPSKAISVIALRASIEISGEEVVEPDSNMLGRDVRSLA